MNPQQFSLRWNNYTSYIAGALDSLRYEEDLVDVTLSCEGRKIRAHKILLSACSPYFKDVFKENPCRHPVIIFKNVRYTDLMALVEFMYQGEVSVPQEQLPSFLHTAEILAVRGLTDNTSDSRQPANTTTNALAQQLMQTQAVLDKTGTITTADSLYLTLPSNSTIVHQPKLVQTQIQTTPIITKPLIKTTPTEMPALTATTTTLAVPITQQQQQQQQPTLTKIQVQAASAQQQPPQQQQQQQQQVHVQVQQVAVQQVQQSQQHTQQQHQQQPTQQTTTNQAQTQQVQQQVQQQQQQQQTTQATTLQEVVDNVVQPRKKKIKLQQFIAPTGSTVTVTTTAGTGPDAEPYDTDTYTITTTKDGRTEQEQEQYAESGQAPGTTLKMEIPEFINVGEPINTESYELVSENIEEKDDDEDMGQDNIEIVSSEMDMSRIFQSSADDQAKSNILQDTELRFRCSICWKGFKHPMSLTLHKDLHSGKTKCPVCLRSFSRSYDMRIHLNKIHQVTLKLDARFNFRNMKPD